ncbi:hypothetical protein DAPPUDRAFT_305754 [Daphnia pulex]|uniref:Uncharacterized protein n=1 Tax=Daphnia pulex TaxID=6669 RepID=E9GSF5_DAPPU|nr:hypothetical protein DAPPUDRAFT_305754 [Daphnia pulex]|eukprot:EFX77415.1 hypothetical protein DAPPUDRAFT_305754 [Daphnia pulex]
MSQKLIRSMHHSNVICVPSDVTHQHFGNKAKEGYLKVKSGVTYSSERNDGQNEASIVLDWTNERTIQIVSGRRAEYRDPRRIPPQKTFHGASKRTFPSLFYSCRYADTLAHIEERSLNLFLKCKGGNSGKIRTGNKTFLGKFLNSCW